MNNGNQLSIRGSRRHGRLWRLFAPIAIVALVLGACGTDDDGAVEDADTTDDTDDTDTTDDTDDTDAADDGRTVELRVSWWGGEERHERYLAAIEVFQEQHPDVDLVVEAEYGDLGPYLERLATQAAANNLPDVIWMRDTHIGRYAAAGQLLDMEPFFGSEIDVEPLGDGVEDGRIEGGVFALPTHFFGQTIMFDPEVLEEAGVDWPVDDATWEDLTDAFRQVSSTTDLWGAQDPTLDDTHRHLEAYIRQNGEELFDHETGELGFSQETYIEWLEMWVELREDGAINPPDDQLERSGHEEMPLTVGQAAFHVGSTNHFPIFQDLTPDRELDLTELPSLEGGATDWRFFPGALISMSAHTDEPEWAARLVNFFLNDTDAADLTEVSHGAPSSQTVRDHLSPQLPEAQARFLDQISSEMEIERRPFPVRPAGAGEINTELQRIQEALAFGSITPEQAAEELWAVADEALEPVDPEDIDLD